MKTALFLAQAALVVVLTGCGSTASVDVPLSYAKLDSGYINSGLYDIGDVFVWDKTNNVLTNDTHLSVPQASLQSGSQVALQQASLSTSTDIVASADLTAYKANGSLSAAVARSTSTQLENARRQRTDALDLANYDNAITLAWRKRMAQEYPGNNFEFFVLDRAIAGSKLTVSNTAAKSASAGANIVSLGTNVKVSVTYNAKNDYVSTAEQGQSAPLVITGTLLRLEGPASDPQFVLASSQETKAFNLQHAMKNLH